MKIGCTGLEISVGMDGIFLAQKDCPAVKYKEGRYTYCLDI